MFRNINEIGSCAPGLLLLAGAVAVASLCAVMALPNSDEIADRAFTRPAAADILESHNRMAATPAQSLSDLQRDERMAACLSAQEGIRATERARVDMIGLTFAARVVALVSLVLVALLIFPALRRLSSKTVQTTASPLPHAGSSVARLAVDSSYVDHQLV
jgi:hypothetical protein